jgi:hypothetical protein
MAANKSPEKRGHDSRKDSRARRAAHGQHMMTYSISLLELHILLLHGLGGSDRNGVISLCGLILEQQRDDLTRCMIDILS